MARTLLPRPLLSLLRIGVFLSLVVTAVAAQTEFPYAAGTASMGRAQAVSDAAGRVLIESPEFPRGLWVDLVDEAGQVLAGIQVEYEGWPDSLVALHCVDPSGLRQETLLWTRPGGDPLRLVLKPDEPTDLPAGLDPIDWRIDPGAEERLDRVEVPRFAGWEALTAFLQQRWRDQTEGRVAVQVESSTVLAVDLVRPEPVVRLVQYMEDRAKRSLVAGVDERPTFQVIVYRQAVESDLALLEGAMVLTPSFNLVEGSELEQWILGELDRREGPVSLSEAAGVTRLNLRYQQVIDVGPLSVLTSLKWLYLGQNGIVDVGPLSALTNLERLELTHNGVIDVRPLAALTSLEDLWLGYNEIVDVRPLATLTSLKWLELSRNEIVDVGPLSALTNLEWLKLNSTEIVDVGPLSALTNLEWLELSGNEIIDVGPLAALTSLGNLGLMHNEIIDVRPLAILTKLKGLSLDNNEIVDVGPLAALTNLKGLGLRRNEIIDVGPLAALSSLQVLVLSRNEIIDVGPLSRLDRLDRVELSYNEIIDVSPLVANPGLGQSDTVHLQDNPLSDKALSEQIPALEARGVIVIY